MRDTHLILRSPLSGRLANSLLVLVLLMIAVAACKGGSTPPPTYQLTLVIEGSGSATIGSSSGDCTDSCTFAVDANATIVVTATPASGFSLTGWSGCDETDGTECTVTIDGDLTVTATFTPTVGTGGLTVAFAGLPEAVGNLGHATLTFPNGDEVELLESTTLQGVPAGEYTLTAHAIEVCDSVLQPVTSWTPFTVPVGDTTLLDVVYASSGVSTQGFKAVIRGVHSNATDVTAYVTVTGAGSAVSIVACVEFWELGDATNPSIREGNPKDVFIEDSPIIASLSPVDQSCNGNESKPECTVYLGGVLQLDPDQLEAFRIGEYYFYVESYSTYGIKLVAQIGAEGEDLVPADGGTLAVDINKDMPPAFDGFELCVRGRFDLGWSSYHGGEQCVSFQNAGVTEFVDNFSGDYEAYISLPAGVENVPAGLEIIGSPAAITPGTEATIIVAYEEPPASGDVDVTFSGLPPGLESFGHVTLTGPGGSEFLVLETSTLHDVPIGEYEVTVHAVEVCGSVIQPLNPSSVISVDDGGTTPLAVQYGLPGPTTQGYKAVIRGVHSNASGPGITAPVDVIEAGHTVSVLSCIVFNESGDAKHGSIRHGNPFNVFIENAPIVWTLRPDSQECETDESGPECVIYLGGAAELDDVQLTALRDGDLYYYVESPIATYGQVLVGQIGSETQQPVPPTGGGLVVDIEVFPEAFDEFLVCIDGWFQLGRESHGDEPCFPLTSARTETFEDLFSGDYKAFIRHETDPENVQPPAGALIPDEPVAVRPGETAAIHISFGGR